MVMGIFLASALAQNWVAGVSLNLEEVDFCGANGFGEGATGGRRTAGALWEW